MLRRRRNEIHFSGWPLLVNTGHFPSIGWTVGQRAGIMGSHCRTAVYQSPLGIDPARLDCGGGAVPRPPLRASLPRLTPRCLITCRDLHSVAPPSCPDSGSSGVQANTTILVV